MQRRQHRGGSELPRTQEEADRTSAPTQPYGRIIGLVGLVVMVGLGLLWLFDPAGMQNLILGLPANTTAPVKVSPLKSELPTPQPKAEDLPSEPKAEVSSTQSNTELSAATDAKPELSSTEPKANITSTTTSSTGASASSHSAESDPAEWKLIMEVDDGKGGKLQIKDGPIPKECNAHKNLDISGTTAVRWGLDHKTGSAAECCSRCQQLWNETTPCHAWVWCGDPSGVCWTPDIHNHTTGACWLKHQQDWDGNTDLSKSNMKINFQGDFSVEFRTEHKTAPQKVPWVAGIIAQQAT